MEFANAQFFRKVEGGGMTIGAGGLPSCGFMAGGIRFESNRPPVLKYKMKPLSRFQSAEFIDSARERFPSDSAILKDAANVTTTGYTAEQNADGYCDRYVLISNESKHTYFFAINRFSP